ncbi:phage tail domain-containing protein [Sporosarcina sp. A2]|uniref:phage tail domain-containing protein n=1 Tax=Sporosarcina sp. A2 TaxID=3393449 RepID=UPI003D7B3F99
MQIYDNQRRQISLETLGLIGLKLHVSPPSFNRETEHVPGVGEITIERTLNPRQLEAELWMKSRDLESSRQDRDKLYSILGRYPFFYISDIPGKLWRVVLDDWNIERVNGRVQELTLPLIASTGRSESLNEIKRAYTGNVVLFDNQGTEPIEPRFQNETSIEVKGASTGLTITNEMTGDVWKYTGNTTASDVVLLKGVESFKNGISIFKDTNKKLLTFAPGVNKLTISGAPSVNLTIRTRFYFL